jgi:hypothetical protein
LAPIAQSGCQVHPPKEPPMKKTDRREAPRQVSFWLGEVLHRELHGFALWAGLEVLGT